MSTGIENAPNHTWLIPRGARDGNPTCELDGLNHADHVVIVGQAMLHIDAYIIEAATCGRLGGNRVGNGEPPAKRALAVGPLLS